MRCSPGASSAGPPRLLPIRLRGKDFRARRLDDWRALLRRHVPQARQILRKLLLVDRVVFTPRTDHYAVVGPWTLGKLASGVVDLPQDMASPRGIALMWTPKIEGEALLAA